MKKVGTIEAFMGKFSETHRNDLTAQHGIMWELDENVLNCRECNQLFSLLIRKHHCRNCGGIYCENCCKEYLNYSINNNNNNNNNKLCNGCKRNECPSERIKQLAQNNCMIDRKKRENDDIKKVILTVPAVMLSLTRGSLYPEDYVHINNNNNNNNNNIPPISGYFEIINKSENEIFCIKLLKSGNHNVIYEAARPSYIVVPPLESLYTNFDVESNNYIDMLILFDNDNKIPSSRIIKYDTSTGHLLPYQSNDISPCAKVENFKHCIIYRIPCKGNNILLKYKNNGIIEPRLGTSSDRIGIFNAVINKYNGNNPLRSNDNQLDMNTNVKKINKVYDSRDEE